MRVLGIDPGLAVTGFGLVDVTERGVEVLRSGCFRTGRGEIALRLHKVYSEITELLRAEKPEEVALEEGFYGKNVKVAMSLGQARGVVLLACAMEEIPLFEYSPREVKQAVVGNGAAAKEQVSYMITHLLKLKEQPQPLDISDALAVAYCHCLKRGAAV